MFKGSQTDSTLRFHIQRRRDMLGQPWGASEHGFTFGPKETTNRGLLNRDTPILTGARRSFLFFFGQEPEELPKHEAWSTELFRLPHLVMPVQPLEFLNRGAFPPLGFWRLLAAALTLCSLL